MNQRKTIHFNSNLCSYNYQYPRISILFHQNFPSIGGNWGAGPSMSSKGKVGAGFNTSWWFQPRWNIFVKLEICPKQGENRKYLKPPPSFMLNRNKQTAVHRGTPEAIHAASTFFWVHNHGRQCMPRPSVWASNFSPLLGLFLVGLQGLQFHTLVGVRRTHVDDVDDFNCWHQ